MSNDFIDSTLNESYASQPRSSYKPVYKYFDHANDDNYDNLTQDYLHLKRKYGSSLENLKANFSKTHDDDFNKRFQKMSILKKKHMQPQTPSKLLFRMDALKKENDLIRQKYEKLNYHESLIERASYENRTRRPYEECYLANEAVVREQYEAKIDFNKIYKELRHPNVKQLNRVLDYAHKFRDYTEKTSVTTIGRSQFDDFELFEL